VARGHHVDYDVVASEYDRRYVANRWKDLDVAVAHFLDGCEGAAVGEVGCGTGHWLAFAASRSIARVFGLDLSWQMLTRARQAAPNAGLARAMAEALPWADGSMDRVLCVNALHHFVDPHRFVRECARVLGPGGGLLVISLDPHTGLDTWWIYDYFPAALAADRERYLSAEYLRSMLTAAGFENVSTAVAQNAPGSVPFETARERGMLDRRWTSQLMVISDEDFASGMARLEADRPVLSADLRLFATTATLSS
jgi:ubiquinone/menaquinone biosynthesis C-methylase UbiE